MYKKTTACLCEKPILSNLWWICAPSGFNIGCPFKKRLIIANSVSNIGTPNAKIGAIIASNVYPFANPNIDTTDNVKPKKFDPTSPIKVFAGLKLYGKNPSVEPTSTAVITIASKLAEVVIKIISSAVAEIADIPAASPSNPSIKFIALVIPIIQSNVIGKSSHPKLIISV